ncbi:hypothetical protein D1O30_00940 [Methylocystis hirsuta]|uniref:Uncharacterized protein n=1 Tax=Methylocystis hirsuta TaxID=369798 RepID=A0A3M9XL54_9HYPH|nr:hypothetical protein D1O30_00940 [Methylocystis hirsuta]
MSWFRRVVSGGHGDPFWLARTAARIACRRRPTRLKAPRPPIHVKMRGHWPRLQPRSLPVDARQAPRQRIAGVLRDGGGIERDFGRKRGLGL